MQIEVFCLCDAASSDTAGKLYILGAFDTINTSIIPATCPQCTIALRIRFDAAERGEHKITVNFVDVDGKHVIPPTNGVMNINFPDTQRAGSANLVLNIQGLRLELLGEYSIDLVIDGNIAANLRLFVKQK